MQLTSVPNFRDLGGVRGAGGRFIRAGLLFRSEAILDPDVADSNALRSAGVKMVCDLRGQAERDHAPNAWWMAQEVPVAAMDVLARIGSQDVWQPLRLDNSAIGAMLAMKMVYRNLPEAAGDHLGEIFAKIAAGNLPLLVHCTAGKDRTGFFCALILEALGVARVDIMSDYLASAGRATTVVVEHTRQMVTKHVGFVDDDVLATLIGVDQSYISESFAEIDEKYGSTHRYLRERAGLSDQRLSVIRECMLE